MEVGVEVRVEVRVEVGVEVGVEVRGEVGVEVRTEVTVGVRHLCQTADTGQRTAVADGASTVGEASVEASRGKKPPQPP